MVPNAKGVTRKSELEALFKMGADVDLSVPNPPKEFSHLINIYVDVRCMGDFNPMQLESYCRLTDTEINPFEFDIIKDIDRVRNLAQSGLDHKKIMESIYG